MDSTDGYCLLHSRTAIGEWQPQIRVPREGIGNVHSIRKIPDGEPIPNYYPPVIDLARFDDIQDSIKARLTSDGSKKFAKGGRKGRGFANLVYGLGSCSHCGGSLILWTKDRKKGKFLRCSNHHYKIVFPNGHSLAGQVCRNNRMFRYDKFESMFLNLFFVRDLIGKLVTHNRSDNSSIEHRHAEVRHEIEKKKRAHQLREFELDDIEDADERRSHREQMRRLLSEVVELERESSELASKIRQHKKMNSADYVERVKAGIARLHCTNEIERENARSTLNAILAERMTVRLTPERIMQAVCSNDDGVQVHGLIPDDPATHGWQIDYTSRTPHIAAKIVAETRAQGRPVQGEIIPPPYPTPFTFEGPRVKPVRGRA